MKGPTIAEAFSKFFADHLTPVALQDADEMWANVGSAFNAAAEGTLKLKPVPKQRRLISQITLNHIEARMLARPRNDYDEEQRVHKLVRQSAREERRDWLPDLAASGS